MPVHDWSRVTAGVFHDFHAVWIAMLRNALNEGLLPPDYYAMAEQVVGSFGPDVLTLQAGTNGTSAPANGGTEASGGGGVLTVTSAPPRVRFTVSTAIDEYVKKQKAVVIRHSSDDRIVALIEIVSPGNKSSRHGLRSFVDKVTTALQTGYHLLLIDLHPPGPRDPQGIHGAVWEELNDASYRAPGDKPLTLAAYSAGRPLTAYIEPVAVGDGLPDMPLFLTPETYVNVPLERTYQSTWRGVPSRWRRVLEGEAPAAGSA